MTHLHIPVPAITRGTLARTHRSEEHTSELGLRPLSCNRAVAHDATEHRRARASLETIDLRALEFGPD